MFDAYLEQIREMLEAEDVRLKSRTYTTNRCNWPRTERQIILDNETAIEMGHPSTESVSFLIWTESAGKVIDNRITIVGPDLDQVKNKQIPFGKIVLVKTTGFDENNAYKRFEQMDQLKYRSEMKGYMLRSVPQNCKEWSRVSKPALQAGFNLKILGSELIKDLKALDFVEAAEIIFITSNKEDVARFKPIGEIVSKATMAMNRMFDNLEYDCAHCSFKDVCDEIEGMKGMHKKATSG